MPNGRYWLCLTITRGGASTSGYAGGVLVVGGSVPPADPNPAGNWDGATVSGRTYQFAGWAFDPNVLRQPVSVDVIDSRPDGSTVSTRFTANGSRPDVAAVYPNLGGNTGFAGSIQLTGAGRHVVCTMVINIGPGANQWLHCGDVVVEPGPSGYYDSVASNGVGTLGVVGWAADPDGPAAVENVHLYASGPNGSTRVIGQTTMPRPDVHAVYPWIGPNSGFATTVPAFGLGLNEVCAYAINLAPPATNPFLGCRDVIVRNAFGYLDSVTVTGGRIVATGWALNPNRPGVPVEVHLYDAGPTGTIRYPGFISDKSRPDVGAAYPGYGPSHGFSASIPAGGAGRHTVCVYAITTGGGMGNPGIACMAVTVS